MRIFLGLLLFLGASCEERTVNITTKPGYVIEVHTQTRIGGATEVVVQADVPRPFVVPLPLFLPINYCQPPKAPITAEKPL